MDIVCLKILLCGITFLQFVSSSIPPLSPKFQLQQNLDEDYRIFSPTATFMLPTTKAATDKQMLKESSQPSSLNVLDTKVTKRNYDFEYQILGGGNFYGHTERQSGKDTKGEYFVILPDLRRQVVKYYVDGGGYHANVSYEPITSLDATVLNLLILPNPALASSNPSDISFQRRRQFKKVVRKRIAKRRNSNMQGAEPSFLLH